MLAVCCGIGLLVIGLVRLFTPSKKPKESNPYIKAHLLKLKNDKDYYDYMEWMAKKGEGVPIPKIKSSEDIRAEKEISKYLK